MLCGGRGGAPKCGDARVALFAYVAMVLELTPHRHVHVYAAAVPVASNRALQRRDGHRGGSVWRRSREGLAASRAGEGAARRSWLWCGGAVQVAPGTSMRMVVRRGGFRRGNACVL
jgi:hypothetical protein